MRRLLSAVLVAASVAMPAQAQAPETADPLPPAAQSPLPAAEDPPPGFEPLRPAEDEAPAAVLPAPLQAPLQAPAEPAEPMPTPILPAPALPAPPAAAPPAAESPVVGPEAVAPAVMPPAAAPAAADLPGWAVAVLILLGAFLAALFGVLAALMMRRSEMARRRHAVAATLATEMETRRQAFEAVPLPPNAEAGVFFVSAITSLAGIDAGFRSAQTDLHLLPAKLAAHVSVHYAAVQRVADFVKGQSLAAAVRMLQANRLGGYPCPDAGTMREAHEELAAAFRGTDKLVASLRDI